MTLCVLISAVMSAHTPALERLAEEVTATVIQHKLEGPMGVFVEGPSPALNRALGSLLMARLAKQKLGPVPVTARDAAEAERWARENQLLSVLRLDVALEGPKLVVRGDALSTWVNFWSGKTATRSAPAAAVTSVVNADAEAVTLGGGTPASSSRPLELTSSVLARLPSRPAALTIADLDGDHRAEIIALVADGISTWTGDGKYKGRVELTAPLTSRPTREPQGVLNFKEGKLLAWSSRRETAEAFTWEHETWRSLAPEGGEGQGEGKTLTTLTTPKAATTRVDIDGDGKPEVLTSTTRAIGDTDELRIITLAAFESLKEGPVMWQKSINGRALMAAAGDLDGDGVDEVVLGTWFDAGTGELLVLKRAP